MYNILAHSRIPIVPSCLVCIFDVKGVLVNVKAKVYSFF